MKTIEVTVAKPYQVHIGRKLLRHAGELAGEIYKPCKLALIMDENVAALYGSVVAKSFARAGFEVVEYCFPAGEQSKSMGQLAHLLEFLAENNLGRSNVLAALGGGVTGDLAGFAASVYQRGIAYIQLPTTLLAAVDSSVGGKTAVNLAAGKNLAGSFWQPGLVVCDCDTLTTLPSPELAAGAAECVKYAVLADPELLCRLREQGLSSCWEEIIPDCVYQKAEIVGQDEKEHGLRQLLNLGHTLGHAVERLSGYTVRHGEAVAIGMMVLSRAAERLHICAEGVAAEIGSALAAFGLPTHCTYPAADLAKAALGDKKRHGSMINLILPRAVGQCIIYPVETDKLEDIIRLGLEES